MIAQLQANYPLITMKNAGKDIKVTCHEQRIF